MRFRYILFTLALLHFVCANANNRFAIKTIVIDAGHGGKDPGAIGPGKTFEKDVALAVALKLGDYIQKNFPEVKVVYTRKTDVFIELHERAEIANKAKADLYIAIHCNASSNDAVYGSSSYVLGLHKTEANLEVAKRENAVILLEDDREKNYEFNPNTPEGHIIMSMKQNAFLEQSILFASKIETEMENFARRKSLGVKQAGFYVLYKTAMPSLLAEIGFISNPDEEKFLLSAKGQDQIALALLNSFKNYKAEVEGSDTNTNTENKAETVVQPQTKKEEPAPTPKEKTPVKEEPKTTTNNLAIEKPAPATKPTETKPVEKPAETTTTPKATEPVVSKEVKSTPVKTKTAETPPPSLAPTPKANSPIEHRSEGGVVFKVQLFVLREELKDYPKLVNLFNEISYEPLQNGLTRYYGGKVKTLAEANKLLKVAVANGQKDAYIVGFTDGKRLTFEQLKAYENQ